MKPKIIMHTAALLCAHLLPAQNNYEQTLLDTLFVGKYADALDYYARHEDSIKTAAYYYQAYQAITSAILNKPDSAIAYLNVLLNEYTYADSGNNALTEDWHYKWLVYTYYHSGDYDNALRYLDRWSAEARHQNEDFGEVKNFIQSRKRYPPMEILNTGETEEIRIKVYAQNPFLCDAQYNNYLCNVSTIFDTGTPVPFVMNKDLADSVGVKILEGPFWSEVNGNKVLNARGVIDSVRIGNLLIKNAMVAVTYNDPAPDSIHSLDHKPSYVMLGLPLIKRLNHIQIYVSGNEMIVSLTKKEPDTKKANMFALFDDSLPGETLYAMSKLNGVSFTAHFNTGADFKDAFLIDKSFYQKHDSMFSCLPENNWDGGIVTLSTLNAHPTFIFLAVPEVLIQVRYLPVDIRSTAFILHDSIDSDFNGMRKGDGTIGNNLLKRFSKITMDFHNMRLELE
jgi:tetratricopeptide (TPR) repeat protein